MRDRTIEDLFAVTPDNPVPVIQSDGKVDYFGKVMSAQEADDYLKLLVKSIDWKPDRANMFGKTIVTKRKVAWYAEKPFSYTYSNTTKRALPWSSVLLDLKSSIEALAGETFNSCLLNLYHDGSEGMAWHSDGETDLKKHGAIGSVSFGAERKFSFKHKVSKESISLVLEHGSLLIMAGATQDHWLHRLPPTKTVSQPRVNLTFRTIEQHCDGSF